MLKLYFSVGAMLNVFAVIINVAMTGINALTYLCAASAVVCFYAAGQSEE